MKGFFIHARLGLVTGVVCAMVGVFLWGSNQAAGETTVSTIYVDASAADGGDGSEARPYNDFVVAVFAAQDNDHDLLIVKSGMYEVPHQNSGSIPIDKDLTIRGENRPTIKLLDGMTLSAWNSNVIIKNLIIEGLNSVSVVKQLSTSTLTLENNIIIGGDKTFYGVDAICLGIVTTGDCGMLYMYNNVVQGSHGIGVWTQNGTNSPFQRAVVMHNNTIVGHDIGLKLHIIKTNGTSIVNNVFIDNKVALDAPYSKDQLDWGYNLFANNDSVELLGETDLVVSEALLDASNHYRPLVGSPVINTGNPATTYQDPDGSRADIGAYGGPNADISTLAVQISTDPLYPSGTDPYTMTLAATNIGSTDFSTVTVQATINGDITISHTNPTASINGKIISWPEIPISAGTTTSFTVQVTPVTAESALIITEASATWESDNNSWVHHLIINGDYIFLPMIGR